MLDKISWLHLSDFHFKAGSDSFSQNVSCQSLIRDIPSRLTTDYPLQFVVVTGDIAFSGQTEEYELASPLFFFPCDHSHVRTQPVCIVPGNHDLDRRIQPYMYDGVRFNLVHQQAVDEFLGRDTDRTQLLQRQSAFHRFRDRLFVDSSAAETDDRLARARFFNLDGFRVCVLELNSAWMSGSQDGSGTLLLGERQIINALGLAEGRQSHLTIALAHHPPEWLAEFDRLPCTSRMARELDVFHSGHLHMHHASVMLTPGSQCLHSTAGSSHETRHYQNSYNLIEYDIADGNCRIRQFEYRALSGDFQELAPIEYVLPSRYEVSASAPELADALRNNVAAAGPYVNYMATLLTGDLEEVPIMLTNDDVILASKTISATAQIAEVRAFLQISNLLKVYDNTPLDEIISKYESSVAGFASLLERLASADTHFAELLVSRERVASQLTGSRLRDTSSYQEQLLDELARYGAHAERVDTATRYFSSCHEAVRVAARRHLASALLAYGDVGKRQEGLTLALQNLDEAWANPSDYCVASAAAESLNDNSLAESIALRALGEWTDDSVLRSYCRSLATQLGSQALRQRLTETEGNG